MKKNICTLVLLLSFVSGVFANTKDKEIALLRQQVNIADNVVIRSNKKEKLPAGQSLKVFLAIKHNKETARDFEDWIAQWNTDNAIKYIKLELVDTIESADIVLAQFVTTKGNYIEESVLTVGTVPKPGERKPKLRVEAGQGATRLPLPVRSFLLFRSNDIWTVVYYDVETNVSEKQRTFPDLRLWSALEKRMKDR